MAALSDTTPDHPQWRKSTQSGHSDCVEVAILKHQIVVRHSKHPNGALLSFSPSEWTAFLQGVRSGEFDLS
jgi:hypothetical protein